MTSDSPSDYDYVYRCLEALGRLTEAKAECEIILRIQPGNQTVAAVLASINIP